MTSYTTNALNTRDFYPVLGEIRFVGTGKTRGYPYRVCKKTLFLEKGRGALIRAGAYSRIITVCDLSVLLDGC